MMRAWLMSIGKTYRNPVIFADYSDPDLVRVQDGYYMTASSFNYTPGLPILYSRDLIRWIHIGYAIKSLGIGFEEPRHSEGIWAPSIRYIADMFYIYYGMPDEGLFVIRGRFRDSLPADMRVLEAGSTEVPEGSYIHDHGMSLDVPGLEHTSIIWDKPVCVMKGKGLIDPCPFVDEDGRFFLIHAYAKSRIGFKSMLGMIELDKTGLKKISADRIIFNGNIADESGKENTDLKYKYITDETPDEKLHPAVTIEGPKVYKRNGYYYIFAPAGGVRFGWQLALRSKDISGPYEYRVVCHQGGSQINGPHQGGMVSDDAGEDFFMHFQDMGPYGRVCHLQPVKWENDWPLIGSDADGSGCGEPVYEYAVPHISGPDGINGRFPAPSDTDLQWMGDYSTEFFEVVLNRDIVVSKDMTDLYYGKSVYGGGQNRLKLQALNMQGIMPIIWKSPNVLTRKVDARNYTVSVTLDVSGLNTGDRAGVTVIGGEYAFVECERISIEPGSDNYRINYGTGRDSGNGMEEKKAQVCTVSAAESVFTVKIRQTDNGVSDNVNQCRPVVSFGFRTDRPDENGIYKTSDISVAGESFAPSDHTWTGAKLGIYAISKASRGGYVIVEGYVWE